MLCRAAFALFAAVSLMAQSRGTISGDVVDATGAAIPAAKVRGRAVAIGIERDTVTNEGGLFSVPGLPAAEYEVAIEAAGFNPCSGRESASRPTRWWRSGWRSKWGS